MVTRIKFFEWADYEDIIFSRIRRSIDLKRFKLSFSPNRFNAEECVGFQVVSIFVDSRISTAELDRLKELDVKTILLRCAGFNMLDVEYAKKIGLRVLRVASYSPESIAEHVFALLLAVVRKLMVDRRKHIALQNNRSAEQMGFVLRGRTIGLYGFGRIAQEVAQIAKFGFGMNVMFYDSFSTFDSLDYQRKDSLEELFASSDIVSVHVPLNADTKGIVNQSILSRARGLILINTARGPIVDTSACLKALENGHLRGFGADVVDEDDSYERLPANDKIVFTQHTAFFTEEAVESIIRQTFENLSAPRSGNAL